MIVVTLLTCIVYGGINIHDEGSQLSTVPFIQSATFTDAIGFSVYAYEGIGLVMPVQDITKDPANYHRIVFAVVVTCALLYIIFGLICVVSWGEEL